MKKHDDLQGKVAIVGLDCRLPGANSVQEFWENLLAEKESMVEFSDEQLIASGVSPATFNNANYVRKRGIVDEADKFDAEFFNFTPREAELLDPQHRHFLECAWHALEDSGIDPFNTDRKVAVFGGTGSPYHFVESIENESVKKFASGTSIVTSNDKDYVTTRVSYKLNLNGPSVNVQSACSTSMVSVILGIDSLLNYQSDVVLAGGATIEIPEHKGYMYQEGGLESPDGKCRTFDKDASGTAFSRGCGVVALKRLEDALEDNDHVYAVILGGAINNDGNRKVGYTAPSVDGQVEVLTETIELAGIDPTTITMVEAHGTSTPVGDPIEVASLSEAFKQYTNEKGYCAIGSVKTNIGHTDVASGIASLIKTCLSLKHGIIPASLNYNEPNPAINFADSPFYVNTKTAAWQKQDGVPARALVNSFGVGGTNACVILEEPPVTDAKQPSHDYDSLFISAHNKNSFRDYFEQIHSFIEQNPEINLNALAHSSRVARKSMKYKGTIAFKNRDDLLARLEAGQSPLSRTTDEEKEFIWMFPGQGNQYINMGLELYKENAIFKEAIDQCSTVLQPLIGLDIREVLYPADSEHEQAQKLLDRTYITQPAIFMVSYATACIFQEYGLEADALIGHSVGEYVAATISGVMTLDDALRSVAFRGKLVYDLPQGSMLAILMSKEELADILPGELDIAVINSPELVVVSGTTSDIETFAAELKGKDVFTKVLPTSHAFHSRMMLPCLEKYRAFFNDVNLHAPSIPIISTVTGEVLSDDMATDHEYWVQHVLKPVMFSDAAGQCLTFPSALFLECGPGQSLESAIKRRLQPGDKHAVIGTLYEKEDAVTAIDTALGKLWTEDISFDFDLRFNSSAYQKIPFPLLPFNRKSHHIDFSARQDPSASQLNLKKENIDDWYYVPSWKKTAALSMVAKNRLEHAGQAKHWVVFSNNNFSDALAERIRLQGMPCTLVRPGDDYRQEGDQLTLRVAEKDDYHRLIEHVSNEDSQLHIIHAWAFSDHAEVELSLGNVDEILDRNFYSLLYLAQAMVEGNLSGQSHLSCLINDGFNVTGNTLVKAEKALSTGPIRVLFKEHIEISTRLINLESSSLNFDHPQALFDLLISETESDTDDTIISYSGLVRWSEIIEPVSLADQQQDISTLIKNNGVYFMTGGGGGIGRTLSLLIAKQANSSFVWTGRSDLPPREEWTDLIAAESTAMNLKEKLEDIQKIEAMGSKVHYYSVEVTDAEEMAKVVEDVELKIGAINGVVHSAGSAGGRVLALQEKSEAEKVLSPKVRGSLILQQIFKDKKLDFIYFFSSITAILGEVGRVDYISANAFMDALSHSAFLKNCETVCSVNWGQWGVIGMAADWQRDKARKKLNGGRAKDKPLAANESVKPIEVSYLMSEGNKELYQVEVNVDDHWVLNEHLLSGMPTLVGTSYLEILNKWKEQKGIDSDLIISNGVFSAPLIIINNAPTTLQLVCEKKDDDQYSFLFRSTAAGSQSENWKSHFSGKLSFSSAAEDEAKEDIPALIEHFSSAPDTERHFTVIRDGKGQMMLQYSSRWDCKEAIYSGDDEWLCKLELPESFSQDLDMFRVHPAMLDVATSAHFMHMTSARGLFLPYSYGEVKISRPFSQSLYCHAKLSKTYETGDQYIYFDFNLYNESGQLLLSIKEYSFVRVGDVGAQDEKASLAKNEPNLIVEDTDILPDEGTEVLTSLLHHPEVSQLIVYTQDLLQDFGNSKIAYLRNKLEKKKKAIDEKADVDDRPDIDTPYEPLENEIEKSISEIWTGILGINKLGANDSFIELGGNSLLGIQVISGISTEFGIDIQANEFVENTNIRALAELVLTKILMEHDSTEIEEALNIESEQS